MKTIGLILFSIILIGTKLNAADSDSLIKINDLDFKNDLEKSTFYAVKASGSFDSVNIFMTSYHEVSNVNNSEVHQRINNCISFLEREIEGKAETKKLKIAYEYIHKTFFKVYKLDNSFSDIFLKGEYNCVSASALYSIIFSRLNIPYQIKETPQHVYLEAYSNTAKVLIETTTPDKGYYQFSDEIALDYVKSLYKRKIISKEEMDTSSTTALFNKYYFFSENITLIQLAGLQYSNYGVYNLQDKAYEAAVGEFKKSYFLYPSERSRFVLKQALFYQLTNNSYNKIEQVRHLVTLCHFHNLKDEEVSNEAIKNEFSRIIQSQLIDNSDYEKFDSSHFLISSALIDTVLRNEIDFNYHYELARLGYVNMKDSTYELKHLEAAYSINPRHANLQSIILGYFVRIIEKNNDPSIIMKQMGQYSQRFNYLVENEQFNSVKANCLLELCFRSFALHNLVAGDNYLKEFESLNEKLKKISPDHSYVEKAYTTAAGVYFKKGNYSRSKQIIKSGLNYAPESFKLKQMLSQF